MVGVVGNWRAPDDEAEYVLHAVSVVAGYFQPEVGGRIADPVLDGPRNVEFFPGGFVEGDEARVEGSPQELVGGQLKDLEDLDAKRSVDDVADLEVLWSNVPLVELQRR